MAGGCGGQVWRTGVMGGVWRAEYGGRNHDVGRFHGLNIIFSASTTTGSHDVSWTWY